MANYISTYTKNYYEKNYKRYGPSFQRKYPNEELCRFVGRTFFKYKLGNRKKLKFLETGCGSAGNLCMLAEEGFNCFGIDISPESIKICEKIFKQKKLHVNLTVGNMLNLPYKNNFFDCIVDVFSSMHLNAKEGNIYLNQVKKKLKKNGIFFSYFPSKKSTMFKSKKKEMIDRDTLFNLNEKKSAFRIKNFPFRFLKKDDYINQLSKNNLNLLYAEEVTKTYFYGKEEFTFIIIVGQKK